MLKYPVIYDGLPVVKTEGEQYYNALMRIYYESGKLQEVTNLARDKGQLGLEDTNEYLNVFMMEEFIILLTIYLINIGDLYCDSEITKSSLNTYKDTFKLVCIRNTMVCRFRDTTTVDLMLAYVLDVENGLFEDVFINEDSTYYTLENSDCFKYLT